MKISASVYSSKTQDLPTLIKELEEHGVDMLHIDCNDDPAVFEDIALIQSHTDLPIDLHLITPTPEKYYDLLIAHPVKYVTFQFESLEAPLEIPQDLTAELGMAIASDTGIDAFDQVANRFSFILFMATVPGRSGGQFNKNNFRKIRKFQAVHPGKKIHVDGGVNAEVSFILRNLGVYAAVVGSYLFSETLGAALLNLKTHEIDSHFLVKDFMRERDELPIMRPDQMNLANVLKSIEEHQLAFTIAVDDKGKLKGLISNADVRRGLLRHLNDFNQLSAEEIINENPIVIEENKTVMELLRFIKSQKVSINYLPVVNDAKEVTGAITFMNLIKGEL